MWLQTFHPTHPLYEALKKHDYPAFAASQLKERQQAAMPPFSFQALVRAEARTQEAAQGFLNLASAAAARHSDTAGLLTQLTLYPAVPMTHGHASPMWSVHRCWWRARHAPRCSAS